jgi:RimJ/RimL family protein N-acetyltransferase
MKFPNQDIPKLSSARIIFINSSVKILKNILAGEEALKHYFALKIQAFRTKFGRLPFAYALECIQKIGRDPRWWNWLPFLISENTLIGNCGYKGSPKNGSVQIGYEGAEDYRGHGLAPRWPSP